MNETQINYLSLISRLFGNLFYRAPTDPILSAVFDWLQRERLTQIWPLEADKESDLALSNLQMKIDLDLLNQEYQKLFGEQGKVFVALSDYGVDLADLESFRATCNIPTPENLNRVALLFLTASWLEDNSDSLLAQQIFFESFLLPCAAKFLTQVETYATLPFYQALSALTREILVAMADELEEEETSS